MEPIKKYLVSEQIRGEERLKWSFQIDAVYCADPEKSQTLAGEVLSKLFCVGNAGGFRIRGPQDNPEYIVIYTSGDDIYWRDEVDNTLGVLLYYGDNRTPGKDLHDTKKGGNRILRNIFNLAASESLEDRKKIPPVFVFKKHNGTRDMQFLGLAVPGIKGKAKKEWLTAVWGCNKEGNRFLNYKAFFTILDTSKGSDSMDSNIPLAWLTDLENRNGYDSQFAPPAWKSYIDGHSVQPLMCKLERMVKTREEQLPSEDLDIQMLKIIHNYFIEKDRGYSFEKFANDLTMSMEDRVVDISTTSPYKDGGFDGIGKYKLFKDSQNEVLVDFYLQAKCYALDNPVVVKDTSRLISRIKDRQFGIMFTTSYVAKQAYEEIMEDGHPIIIMTGKNIIDYLKKEEEIYTRDSLVKWLAKRY